MSRVPLAVAVAFGLATPLAAQDDGPASLSRALGLADIVEIMATEGIAYGDDLEAEMFPGRGGRSWDDLVAALYDSDTMARTVEDRFAAEMEGVDLGPLLDFFGSGPGREIIEMEIEARRAMLDDAVEEAAEEQLAEMREADAPRLEMLDTFIEVNDLVEQNVVGALNANFAFYTGMMAGDAFGGSMTEDDALRDVWAQEAEIRADTIEWLYAYLNLAYQPLDDDQIAAYTDLSRTEEGEALNAALFAAFDEMYTTISRGLGEGAARFMAGEDI